MDDRQEAIELAGAALREVGMESRRCRTSDAIKITRDQARQAVDEALAAGATQAEIDAAYRRR